MNILKKESGLSQNAEIHPNKTTDQLNYYLYLEMMEERINESVEESEFVSIKFINVEDL